MTDPSPESAPVAVDCRYCRHSYNPEDPAEVKRHNESIDCEQSCRCRGKPRCYLCHGSFCVCNSH